MPRTRDDDHIWRTNNGVADAANWFRHEPPVSESRLPQWSFSVSYKRSFVRRSKIA